LFDPIGGAFAANRTGADVVIDSLTLTIGNSGGYKLASTGNVAGGITLSHNTTASTLTSGGSFAGAQSSINAAWSTTFGSFDFGPPVSKVQVLGVPGTGASSTAAVEGSVNTATTFSSTGQFSAMVTAGVDQSGTQECTASCSFAAIATGISRSVLFFRPAGVASFYDIWTDLS
jgi:hypothetical protein